MVAKVVPAVRLPVKASETYDYQIPATLAPAVGRGAVVIIPFAGRQIPGLVVSVSEKTEHAKPLKEIVGIAQGLSPLPVHIVDLWTKLSHGFATTLPRFIYAALPAIPSRAISIVIPSAARDLNVSTEAQRFLALDGSTTRARNDNKKFSFANSSLDTLKIVKDAIANANGGQVLILVPTVDEVAVWLKTIGNAIAYHSSLATGAKYNLSCAAASGTAKIIVGTKIAVFLPFAKLAQIVIVNAGSSSHLQEDQDPRYDARVIAEELSLATGAALSAIDPLPPLGMTPAGSDGRWVFANEPTAFTPVVHDLHDAAKAAKARVLVSEKLETAIDETVSAGGRVMVVLNRRGISTAYVCRDCGTVINCTECGIPLTVHQDRMSCSACERLYPLPDSCPKCNGLDLKTIGAGSKTIYEALKKRHPLSVIAHVDRDSWQTNLDAAQIVVGTTAVFNSFAPSHQQFDLVADALLGAGQMKSGIWSTESAARVLRTLVSFLKPAGQLHVQTFDATAPALKAINDPTGFLANEFEERAAFGYPPVKNLVIMHGAGDSEDTLLKQAGELVDTFRNRVQNVMSGTPIWSHPKKFRGKFRLTIVVKVPHSQDPHDLVQYFPTGFSAEVRKM